MVSNEIYDRYRQRRGASGAHSGQPNYDDLPQSQRLVESVSATLILRHKQKRDLVTSLFCLVT